MGLYEDNKALGLLEELTSEVKSLSQGMNTVLHALEHLGRGMTTVVDKVDGASTDQTQTAAVTDQTTTAAAETSTGTPAANESPSPANESPTDTGGNTETVGQSQVGPAKSSR
jgi:hypothetical protein